MILILIIILAVALGILLSRSPSDEGTGISASRISAASRSWADRAGEWLKFSQPKAETPAFREWATGEGAANFPEDFREWLGGLSAADAERFSAALSGYSKGLGYNLTELVEGSLNDRPSLLNVFVEAIVIYSQEYRKALKAHEETDDAPDGEAPVAEEKKPAQKQASRRKTGSAGASA
jgi:hypothetical protein